MQSIAATINGALALYYTNRFSVWKRFETMAGKNQHVVLHNGKWAVKNEGSKRVTSVYDTKQEAIDAARKIASSQDVEVIIHGRSGQIFRKTEARSSINEDKLREFVRENSPDRTRRASSNKKRARKSSARGA